MIKGIGVDIVKIQRIKEAVEKWGERFLHRIYSGRELDYCLQKHNPYESLAVRFAAKEAFLKASGRQFNFKDIEILNDSAGRPYINIPLSCCLPTNKDPGGRDQLLQVLHLSLSHDSDYAIAMVIIEENP